MQGCKVNLKLEEKVLLAWEKDREEDRSGSKMFVVCQAGRQQAGDGPPALPGHPPLPPGPGGVLPRRQPSGVWLPHGLPGQDVGAHRDRLEEKNIVTHCDWRCCVCPRINTYISIIFPYWLLIFNLCSVNVTQVLSIYQSLLRNYQWLRSIEEKVRTFQPQ